MARPGIRRIGRNAIAIVVILALVIPWALLRASWFRQWWLTQQWSSWDLIAVAANAALVLLVAIWWLWWRLPKRQVHDLDIQIHDPKARAETEDNFRKTVGQALGGAAVLIGAVIAYLQFTQQQQASHDLLISNQVSKGFEQLASDKIAERLGGIYALEGVMNTSDQYKQPVLEALCAFVRESTTRHKGPLTVLIETFTAPRDGTAEKAPPPYDIQAALTVIGRRKAGPGDVNLAGAKISGALLDDALLAGANLARADLSHTVLTDANLSRAFLAGANLSGAGPVFANLRGAVLRGANLSGANLSGANLRDTDLRDTDLSHASLWVANMAGADLSIGRNVTQEQLDQACGKPKALPEGLHLDKPCPPPKAQ
jgi:hypothetical protein